MDYTSSNPEGFTFRRLTREPTPDEMEIINIFCDLEGITFCNLSQYEKANLFYELFPKLHKLKK